MRSLNSIGAIVVAAPARVARRREDLVRDLRAVDRRELGLRPLGEGERHRSRSQECDAERGREHPGHGPGILRRLPCLEPPQAADPAVVQPHEQGDGDATPEPDGDTTFACGTGTSFSPDSTRTTPKPIRSERSGTRTESCEPISTPGIEPVRSQSIACLSTSPWSRCEMPATQSSTAAWNMSVPTIFWRGERVGEEHREAEEGARADRGEADDEAAEAADQDRDRLVARREEERRVAAAAA